jgi:hypothetical protein
MKLATNVLALSVALQLALVADAQAYIDPGTGSFIFQAVLAMLLSAGVAVKLQWRRIKLMFQRKQALPADTQSEPAKDPEAIV